MASVVKVGTPQKSSNPPKVSAPVCLGFIWDKISYPVIWGFCLTIIRIPSLNGLDSMENIRFFFHGSSGFS